MPKRDLLAGSSSGRAAEGSVSRGVRLRTPVTAADVAPGARRAQGLRPRRRPRGPPLLGESLMGDASYGAAFENVPWSLPITCERAYAADQLTAGASGSTAGSCWR